MLPSVLRVGGVQLSVALPLPPDDAAETTIANAGSEAVDLPSLTRIVMPLLVPAAVGVPASLPVEVLNDAHEGLFAMLKVSASPFASLAVGVNAYAVPTVAEVPGVPVIVGAEFEPDPDEPETVRLNQGRAAEETPSEAMIMM